MQSNKSNKWFYLPRASLWISLDRLNPSNSYFQGPPNQSLLFHLPKNGQGNASPKKVGTNKAVSSLPPEPDRSVANGNFVPWIFAWYESAVTRSHFGEGSSWGSRQHKEQNLHTIQKKWARRKTNKSQWLVSILFPGLFNRTSSNYRPASMQEGVHVRPLRKSKEDVLRLDVLREKLKVSKRVWKPFAGVLLTLAQFHWSIFYNLFASAKPTQTTGPCGSQSRPWQEADQAYTTRMNWKE